MCRFGNQSDKVLDSGMLLMMDMHLSRKDAGKYVS